MLKIGTAFSGIGSPEQAIKELGIEHRNVFACDIDKYARQTYLANFSPEQMFEDFTLMDYSAIEELDLFIAGFPCQAFSLAGKRKGFDEIRGTLFFNCAEFIRVNQPKYFILENVKGLLSHDKPKGSKNKTGRTFGTIINLLSQTINNQTNLFPTEGCLNYNVHYQVLNSKNFGVPQNRERIFIIGIRKDLPNHFRFPVGFPLEKRLKDVLETNVDEKYYLSEKMLEFITKHREKRESANKYPLPENGVSGCLNARYHKMGAEDNYVQSPSCSNEIFVPEATKKGFATAEEGDSINISNPNSSTRRGRVGKGIANTLETGQNQVVVEPLKVAFVSRSEEGKAIRKKSMEEGKDFTPFQAKQIEFREQDFMNTITTATTKDNLISVPPTLDKIGQLPGYESIGRIDSADGLSPTVTAKQGGGHEPFTQTQNRIRRLTPLECFRLQGFSDDFVKPCSDTQTYKQAGNSITVHVIKAILKNLLLPEG